MAKGKLPKVLARQGADQKLPEGPSHFESTRYLDHKLQGVKRKPEDVKKKPNSGQPMPGPKSGTRNPL